MTALKGYISGGAIVAEDAVPDSYDGKEVIITILDKSFEGKNVSDAKKKLEIMKSFFGTLSHEEAEDIRKNRVNFKERS